MNKAVKAIEKAGSSTRKPNKKKTTGVSNISTSPQTNPQGCLFPLLLVVALPIVVSLFA